tara:strand:- start:635 stop:2305 length:1671 start_codon:yes stop_codon:yes gene_type:complete
MTINIADNSPRISYSVSQGATTTSFAVPFEFFDNADLNVYVDGTLKTITTHYTVSGGDGSTGTVSISVTGITGGSTVVITRDIALERTTDFPVSGAFNIVSLNTELDRMIAIAADLEDQANRALQLTDFDAAVSLVLPDVDTRKGKTLAFNASSGAVEAGPSISDVQTVSAAATDIALLANIQDGTTATNAITTCATKSSEITSVAAKASLLTSDFVSDLNTLAVTDVINDINLLATSDIVSDLNTLATSDIVSDINTLATSDIVSDLNTLATSDIVSDINTLATSDIVSDLNTLATSDFVSDLNTLATTANVNNISTVATNISGVNSFAERYRIGSSDPSSSLDEGDLFYNSTSNVVKVYNGSAWQNVAPVATSLTVSQISDLTATASELNIMDGVTSTATEINLLDGVTATTTELNYLDISTLGLSQASKVVTADANGVVSFDNGTIEESTAITSSSNAATLNLRDGNIFTHTLSENVTYTFSNPAASGRASAFILKVVQDSSARTITWPNTVDWAAATAPTITATNAGVDVFAFITVDGGTNYYGFTLGQAMG